MSRDLKAIAGLSPTPPPPDAKTIADLAKDVGKDLPKALDSRRADDGVEALLALTDASAPVVAPGPPPLAPPPAPAPGFAPAAAPAPNFAPAAAPAPGFAPAPAPVPPPPYAQPAPVPAAPAPYAPASYAPAPYAPASAPAPGFAVPYAPPSAPAPAPAAPAPGFAVPYGSAAPPAFAAPTPAPPPYVPPAAPPSNIAAPAPRRPATESPSRTKGESSTARPGRREKGPATTRRRSRSGEPPRAPKTGFAMLVLALLVLGGGAAAVWKFAPQIFTGKRRPQVPTASASPTASPAPKCKVALVLTDVPANAEILLRMGQAPADVERMPVGTRLELVATAEGYAPRRAVIKAESPWDRGADGKPRIEVPIQLDPSKAKPGTVDPWPAAEPGSQVGGSGAPGTLHVVSNVRGADIWLLAGLGPEARIDQLRCDADIDVLLAGPPSLRKRIKVSEKDLAAVASDAQGTRVVSVSAK